MGHKLPNNLSLHVQLINEKDVNCFSSKINIYSQICLHIIKKSVPVKYEEKVKKVVQELVTDEDQSKNVMVLD